MKHLQRAVLTGMLMLWCLVGTALAHPHIWIEAQTIVRFDAAGAVTGLRHIWKFDDAFSAWAIQGLDVDGDGEISQSEFAPLALDQVSGLSEYDFFTFVGEGDLDLALLVDGTPSMYQRDGRVVLDFGVRFEQPYAIADALEIAVLDPEYYVAIDLVADTPVLLEGAASDCAINIEPPKQLDPEMEAQFFAIGPDVTQLPEHLKAAVRDTGHTIVISCAGGTVAPVEAPVVTEVETAEPAVLTPREAPFSAPPVQIGLPLPRTGLVAWVNIQQREFYRALTGALGQLKTDGNAFWALGILSFLYGVFHAAGPGHGKVVISSYVLATQQQVWRGVGMSFASAMMQSFVAVSFVLVAALALNLTSSVMSDAATWLIIVSYAMIVVLGIWLIVRKLFGSGHHHDHQHGDDHDHEHSHQHVVAPAQTGGSWREMAGVVMAVGLRPCSGALVVLVFALSQGVLLAGIAATFLMGLGTAITVGVLASLALSIKQGLGRLGGRHSRLAASILWWLELLGAMAVLGFGLALLTASFV